jgi:hypothetical protein
LLTGHGASWKNGRKTCCEAEKASCEGWLIDLKENEGRVAAAAVEALPPRLNHGGKAPHEGSGIASVGFALIPLWMLKKYSVEGGVVDQYTPAIDSRVRG